MLLATEAYASGLGIVTGVIKDHITLILLSDSSSHTLGYITSKQKKLPLLWKPLLKPFVTN